MLRPLNDASYSGNMNTFRRLIEGGEEYEGSLNQFLSAAARYGQMDIARYVLGRGARFETALLSAAYASPIDVLELFLDYG